MAKLKHNPTHTWRKSHVFHSVLALGAMACLALAWPTPSSGASAAPATITSVAIDYYFEPNCEDCERIQAEVMPDLEARYEGLYKLTRFSMENTNNYSRLAELEKKFGITTNASVNMVINEKNVLCGFERIRDGLFPTLDKIISESGNNEP